MSDCASWNGDCGAVVPHPPCARTSGQSRMRDDPDAAGVQ